MADDLAMKRQWDEIASENAFYGVLSLDDFEDAGSVDLSRFWETGRRDVEGFMEIAGLGETRDLHMLEIGCGLGRMTHCFANRFGKVYALDVSEQMLDRARGYWACLKNVEWVVGNGRDLQGIASSSIDFVFSYLVLQHVPSADLAVSYIQESARVLKEGGTAFLQFQIVPRGVSRAALQHWVRCCLPPPVIRFLRWEWERMPGNGRLRRRFARRYDAWRGCPLQPAFIEATAAGSQLRVRKQATLGAKYRYYVFQKVVSPCVPPGC